MPPELASVHDVEYTDDVLTYRQGEELPDLDSVLSTELADLDIEWEYVVQDLLCSAVSNHTSLCTTSNNCGC